MNEAWHPAERATQVIAIRHGQTDWNTQQRVQGHTDIALNEAGRAQAERLRATLQGEPICAVYASDLRRASETAQVICDALDLELRLDPGLRERAFGDFEGHTYADIESLWPEAALAWRRRDPGFAPPGGETLPAFHQRCVSAARRLAARHPGELIVLVAHGGVLDALYRAATGAGLVAPRTWQLSNAAVNRLLVTDEGLTLVGWNDCRHLEQP